MVRYALVRFSAMINIEGRGPLWRRVLADLRRRVLAGEFPERMPSERHLADEYGCSMGTVQHALRQLRIEGLIATDKGYGSYVVDGPSGTTQ